MSRQAGDRLVPGGAAAAPTTPGADSDPAPATPVIKELTATRPRRSLLDEEAEGPLTLTNHRPALPEWVLQHPLPTVAPVPAPAPAPAPAPTPVAPFEEAAPAHPLLDKPWLAGLVGAAAMLFVLAFIHALRGGGAEAAAPNAGAATVEALAQAPAAPLPEAAPPPAPIVGGAQIEIINFPDGGTAVSSATVLPQWALTCPRVRVVGHTCNQGSPSENLRTGKVRAESVRSRLIAFGVDPSHIIVESKGDTDPIADNRTGEGRRRNRRVELSCMGDGA